MDAIKYGEARAKEEYTELVNGAAYCGIQYGDFLEMDFRQLKSYELGVLQWRENDININKNILHNIAGKIAQANHGSKDFEKKIKDIDLTSTLQDNRRNSISKKQIDTLERIKKQYGIDITKQEV